MFNLEQPRILHVITGLGTGGAEMMLVKLLGAMPSTVTSKVVVLVGHGSLSEKVEHLGVEVEYLGIRRGRWPNLGAISRILAITKSFGPNVIQGWMYHGNIAAWFISCSACRRAKLIWNIRQTLYDVKLEKSMTRWLIRLSRRLSSRPIKIIYNSQLSAIQHEALGYPYLSRVLIPNGFDCNKFKTEPSVPASVRDELGLPPNVRLVIHVARYHPMKDHRTLLMAAKTVSQRFPTARFLLVGLGVTDENEDLKSLCYDLGVRNTVNLLGERFDLPRLMSAADLVVLSSAWGEGFPNVIGEAMACGKPCVVTDVGDSASVLGDCGCVVPPKDPHALADAIGRMLADDRLLQDLGAKARRRVQDLYSIEQVSKSYLDLYRVSLS